MDRLIRGRKREEEEGRPKKWSFAARARRPFPRLFNLGCERAGERASDRGGEGRGGRAANGKGRKRGGGGGRRRRRMALMPQIVMTSIDTKGYLSVRHGVSELRASVGRFKETTDINQHVGFKTRMARLLQDFLIAFRTLPKNIVREVFGLCRGAARRGGGLTSLSITKIRRGRRGSIFRTPKDFLPLSLSTHSLPVESGFSLLLLPTPISHHDRDRHPFKSFPNHGQHDKMTCTTNLRKGGTTLGSDCEKSRSH